MPTNYRGLAFLLSIGSLPFACTKDNDDTDSGGSTTTPGTSPTGTTGTGSDTTDPTTGNSMSSDPTTTGNSASGTTTGNTTGTTTGPLDTSATEPEMTTFLTTNTETGFETDEPPPPMPTDPTCIAYGQHVVECNPRYAGYQDDIAGGCEYYKAYALRTDGQACVDALDALYVCLSKVDCAELMDPEMPPPSCADEIAAIDMVCPSFNDHGMTTGGSDEGGSSTG